MVYTYNGIARTIPRRSWTRPKERIAGNTYMRVRDKDLIKELRVDKGITQNQLATLANCSQSTISAIENGHMTTISVDLGEHVSRWLDRRPRELFDEFDDAEFNAARVKNVARNKRQRKAVEPAA